MYWYSFSNPRAKCLTKCIHYDSSLVITVYAYHYGEYGEYGDYSSKIMIMRERERERKRALLGTISITGEIERGLMVMN